MSRCLFGLPSWHLRSAWLFRQRWDVHIVQAFFIIGSSCWYIRIYALWDLPGDVLATVASALCGWKGVILYLSLSSTLSTSVEPAS